MKQKIINDLRGWQKHIRRTAQDENLAKKTKRKLHYRASLINEMISTAEIDPRIPSIIWAIDEFDTECQEKNYTDTCEAWKLLNEIRKQLNELYKEGK